MRLSDKDFWFITRNIFVSENTSGIMLFLLTCVGIVYNQVSFNHSILLDNYYVRSTD